MNDDFLDKLFSKAREVERHDTSRVELGFETRLATHLQTERAFAPWPWRLLPFFAVLTIYVTWSAWHDRPTEDLILRAALADQTENMILVKSVTGGGLYE